MRSLVAVRWKCPTERRPAKPDVVPDLRWLGRIAMIFQYLGFNQKQDPRNRGLGYMDDRYVAASARDFVRQLATCYLPRGYWFYVFGLVREGKDPRVVDRKVVAKYGIGSSAQSRRCREPASTAHIQYLRFDRAFILLATDGHHPLLDDQRDNVCDARCVPIRFRGYLVGGQRCRASGKRTPNTEPTGSCKWRVHVQIEPELYRCIVAYFLAVATRRSADQLADDLRALPYEPYSGVRGQLEDILQLINGVRGLVAMPPLDHGVLRDSRRMTNSSDARAQSPARARRFRADAREDVGSEQSGRILLAGPLTSRTKRVR